MESIGLRKPELKREQKKEGLTGYVRLRRKAVLSARRIGPTYALILSNFYGSLNLAF